MSWQMRVRHGVLTVFRAQAPPTRRVSSPRTTVYSAAEVKQHAATENVPAAALSRVPSATRRKGVKRPPPMLRPRTSKFNVVQRAGVPRNATVRVIATMSETTAFTTVHNCANAAGSRDALAPNSATKPSSEEGRGMGWCGAVLVHQVGTEDNRLEPEAGEGIRQKGVEDSTAYCAKGVKETDPAQAEEPANQRNTHAG